MKQSVRGIHHITAIAGDPQLNVAFYTNVLGMRLVKKSINQDAPDTYHLFYADGAGNPGTDLTFFPWPSLGPGQGGVGVWGEVSFVVSDDSLEYWQERLTEFGVAQAPMEERFGERVLPFVDPHGMRLAFVGTDRYAEQPSSPWNASPVPEAFQIQALGGVRLTVTDDDATTAFLNGSFGFSKTATERSWTRYTVGEGAGGQRIDIHIDPGEKRGRWGTGSVHHVAFRVTSDEEELLLRDQVIGAGGRPTEVIDRFWFKSVYVREPSGALCEIATDLPGFAVDEDPEHLGESLVLPPWYEAQREKIEAILPTLTVEWADTGHRFDRSEIDAVKAWLNGYMTTDPQVAHRGSRFDHTTGSTRSNREG